jgi:serine/threonine-protein kinase SRK2
MLPAEPTPLNEQTKYQYVSTLGKGAFGFVQLAKNTHIESQELVAIKFLRRTDVNKYVEAEIVNHSLLRHPHVIHFKEVFLTRQYICIVMELASGGSLFHYVQKQGRLKEAVARWFFQQLMVGVDYCHKRGVANRDIKLENTLLQVGGGGPARARARPARAPRQPPCPCRCPRQAQRPRTHLQIVPKLPLPLLKICDFGYSKADFKSAAKSKVSRAGAHTQAARRQGRPRAARLPCTAAVQ